MLRQILNALTIFDWVSPLVANVESVTHGNAYTFFISWPEAEAAGWGELSLRVYLAQYGVETWGVLLYNDELTLAVKPDQAKLASVLLDEAGMEWRL